MKNILVTGGTGAIGSNLVKKLLAKEDTNKLIILDDPYKSCCYPTYNYKNFLSKPNIKTVFVENWKDNLHPKIACICIAFSIAYCFDMITLGFNSKTSK